MNKTSLESSNTKGEVCDEAAATDRWIEKAQAGDEDAFGEIVKMYHVRVSGVIYGVVNNVEDAKELAQQTWVKAWQKLPTFKKEARFFTWLYRIATNTSLDFMRQQARRRETALEDMTGGQDEHRIEWPVASGVSPDRDVMHDEVREAFDMALQSVSPEHRAALILREVEGRSYKEIAKIMKCRAGTVMSRIFYARKTIQEQMKGVR